MGVPPNATLILKHLGYSKERARAVDYFGVSLPITLFTDYPSSAQH